MKLEYSITENDYIVFNQFHAENSKSLKRMHLYLRFMMPFIAVLIIFYDIFVKSSHSVVFIALLFFVSLVWFIYYPQRFKDQIAKNALKMIREGKNRDMLGKHTFELSDNGILETTENGEMKINWDGIEKYLESKEFFYIYMSSIQAFIIPKSAFNSNEQEECIFRRIRTAIPELSGQ